MLLASVALSLGLFAHTVLSQDQIPFGSTDKLSQSNGFQASVDFAQSTLSEDERELLILKLFQGMLPSAITRHSLHLAPV
jgi:hypothetical protein